MKPILIIIYTTLLVLLFAGQLAALAQPQSTGQAVLHLRLSRNLPFKITFDGEKGQDVRAEHVITTFAGQHKLRVLLPPPPDKPYHPTLTLFKDKIRLKPNTETFAYIDRNGNFRVHREQMLSYNPTPQNPPPPYQPENPYEYGSDNGQYQPQYQPVPPPITPLPAALPRVMSTQDFEQLKQIIRDSPFDDNRLAIAKQSISTNNLASEQVRNLLDCFSFEASRLALAKFAYSHCIDPQNYHVVYAGFKFNGSTNELLEYIKTIK